MTILLGFQCYWQENVPNAIVPAAQETQENGHNPVVPAAQETQENGHNPIVPAAQETQENGHNPVVSAAQKTIFAYLNQEIKNSINTCRRIY
jgi:DNA-directed RNA polymerase subunit K/omega